MDQLRARLAAVEAENQKMVQLLHESESRYRLLAENVSDVIVTTDLDLRPTFLSPSITRLLGYTHTVAMAQTLGSVLTNRSMDLALKAFQEELEADGAGNGQSEPRLMDLELIRNDGSTVWVESASVLLHDQAGSVVGLLALVRDISLRKQAEDALRDSERGYRLLAENVSDVIWTMDTQMRYTYISPSIERLRGYSVEEAKSHNLDQNVTPASAELALRTLADEQEAERLGLQDRYTTVTLEMELTCKDGSTIWTENKISYLRDASGKLVGYLGVTRDISERKRAEDLFKTLADSSPVGIYIVQDGRFKFANPQFRKSTGYSERELLGMQSLQFATVEDRASVRENAIRMLKGQRVLPYEYRMINKHGEPRWVLETVVSIPYQGQRATLGNYMDITDRKKAEEELEKSIKKLQRILDETVEVLASVAEKRDPYTAGHQRRVAQLATAIARTMGLPEDAIEGIRVAGLLHDIGKIYVPAEILSKPGRISDYEFNIIKTHPQVGHDIVKNIEFPWPVADIILQHHERMGGTGYPAGLCRDRIMQEAMILSVADVVEAMSSHRPYRSALGIDSALDEVVQNQGTLYDADVVAACLSLFNDQGFNFDQASHAWI